jgi:hypothetical protein
MVLWVVQYLIEWCWLCEEDFALCWALLCWTSLLWTNHSVNEAGTSNFKKISTDFFYLQWHNHLAKSLGFLSSKWDLQMSITETGQDNFFLEQPVKIIYQFILLWFEEKGEMWGIWVSERLIQILTDADLRSVSQLNTCKRIFMKAQGIDGA